MTKECENIYRLLASECPEKPALKVPTDDRGGEPSEVNQNHADEYAKQTAWYPERQANP
jgi:hypothetical protein